MSEPSFTTSFSVSQTPQEAFAAVTDVRGWWTEDIEGDTAHVGEEFAYHAGDLHRCRIRVTEVVPGAKVSWLVLENYFGDVEDTTEWQNSTITFEITEQDGGTEVRFTHHGLVPEYECFDSCSVAWGFFVNTSLRDLITTGTGLPNGRTRLRMPADM
jgi:uncharacterized protein YndB with AHSA1/START domain